tara:strand:+ start:6352 stop:6648 length:297 start_codon:yes stop_codon:yes gene_type:complete
MAGSKNRETMAGPKRLKDSLKKELESWAGEFASHYGAVVDEVPEGWVTVKYLAKEMGRSEVNIRNKLRKTIEAGKVSVKKFRINVGGRVMYVPHYKLK